MINYNNCIDSLPKTVEEVSKKEISHLDPNIWVNTIPKKNIFNSLGKYSLMATLFICGLLIVSAVKNETRNLQKEINGLQASISSLNSNLDQAILDNEVITSPENISKLAEEYLSENFISYKRSQISNLQPETQENLNKANIEKNFKKKVSLSINIKSQVAKKIEKKKTEIRKLQALYSNPEEIPEEVKKQIERKKVELKNIYNAPKEIINLGKAQKWAAVQVVKAFLGMPIVPGR